MWRYWRVGGTAGGRGIQAEAAAVAIRSAAPRASVPGGVDRAHRGPGNPVRKPELTRSGRDARGGRCHWATRLGRRPLRSRPSPKTCRLRAGGSRRDRVNRGLAIRAARQQGAAHGTEPRRPRPAAACPPGPRPRRAARLGDDRRGQPPHTFPEPAAAHAAGEYEVPFCPQLPRLEGDMVREWLGADPLRCGWAPERDRERPAARGPFPAALGRRPPAHGVVKLQVTGPVTLAAALEPDRTAAAPLAREIAAWLAGNAAGQIATLRARGLTALLVVDEPALASAQPSDDRVWDPLRAVAPAWGLHLCCAVPWALVERAAPDVLSFDLALGTPGRDGARVLARHLARGGRVAWGVLAAHRRERAAHAAWRLPPPLARLRLSPAAAGPGSPPPAPCGTRPVSPPRLAEGPPRPADVAGGARAG